MSDQKEKGDGKLSEKEGKNELIFCELSWAIESGVLFLFSVLNKFMIQ